MREPELDDLVLCEGEAVARVSQSLKKSWVKIEILRSSHRRCSVRKEVLRISQNSQENTCTRVSLLIKLQAESLELYQKWDSGTGVSLSILRNLWEQLFHRIPPGDCFGIFTNKVKILLGNLQMNGFLKRLDASAFLLKKLISPRGFFCKTKSRLIEIAIMQKWCITFSNGRSSHQRCSMIKMLLKIFQN